MTSRDDRSRRAAARLHHVAVGLAAEVVAKGGSLDWHDLTEEERAEAEAMAVDFWPKRLTQVAAMSETGVRSRRMGRPPSTDST